MTLHVQRDHSAFFARRSFTAVPDEDDERFPPPPEHDAAEAAAEIKASPFVWCEPAKIPAREWLYGGHLIRRYVSVTISPGGVGKSSLAIAEALAMTSGRDLLGHLPTAPLRVWYWNGEDPTDELQRRIMAAAMHYGLKRAEVEGRLFANSGRDTEIVIAQQNRDGVTIAVPVVEAVKRTIRENKIDVVVIDPFVSSHAVGENDNGAIDRVAKTWGRIAEETGCAVELIHHARKTNGNEVSVEDSRGAVALLSAARSARALNVMSKEEAERAGVEHRRLHFRVDNGKANLAPPPEGSSWFKLASVDLNNGGTLNGMPLPGDSVGVVTQWKWPDPLESVSVADLRAVQKVVSDGQWRENHQAKNWVGHAVATAMRLDVNEPIHRRRILAMLKVWKETKMLVVVDARDEKGNLRPFVEVGEWASD